MVCFSLKSVTSRYSIFPNFPKCGYSRPSPISTPASTNFLFDDVKADNWFYSVVMNAFNCGIIEGDSERTFSPNRNVNREEITVMLASALQYANLRCSNSKVTNYVDEDKILSWSKDAYKYIGQNVVSDYDNTNCEKPVRLLNSQKLATRADIAYILNNAQDNCQLYASELAVMFGFDKRCL